MIEALIFDLDGVVYRGTHGIPGVAGEIYRLQQKVPVLFLTNNATKSRADYVRLLAGFGIGAKSEQISTSAYGTARMIVKKWGRGKKIHVVGESGLADELETEAGARIVEEGADIVVCGLDRGITYQKLTGGLRNLAAGAHFVLANADATYPTEDGISPGSGSIAASLIYASGRQPDIVVGKPSTFLIDNLMKLHRVDPKKAAFIGDRLDIDMRMANSLGMKSVLVLTGIAKEKDLKKAPKSDKPDIVLKTAAEVGKALGF